MIQVALDWNCVIEIEEARKQLPYLQQLQQWYTEGKIALCLLTTVMLENPRGLGTLAIDSETLKHKLRAVGLEGIEIRSTQNRGLQRGDGVVVYDMQIERWLTQVIQARLFPNVPARYDDYCRQQGVELIPIPADHLHRASWLRERSVLA